VVNNPASGSFPEFLARIMDTKVEYAKTWVETKMLTEPAVLNQTVLHTGDKEYSVMFGILNELLPSKFPVQSALRRQLFETVKSINFTKMNFGFTSNQILKKLLALSHSDNFWAKIGDIYVRINNGRDMIISESKIEKELRTLISTGVIERKRIKENDSYGYYVTTDYIDKGIILPPTQKLFHI
jgi:hypothetical protein